MDCTPPWVGESKHSTRPSPTGISIAVGRVHNVVLPTPLQCTVERLVMPQKAILCTTVADRENIDDSLLHRFVAELFFFSGGTRKKTLPPRP